MEITEHIKSLEHEGRLLAASCAASGTEAPVPTCPGWQVRDLLRHTGAVHRWAAGFVVERRTAPRSIGDGSDLDGAELIDWFRDGHTALVAALSEAPAELECFTFMPAPSPLAFWARRQAHETAVHRMDAEAAAGARFSPLGTDFAVDGIDELLRLFHARLKSRVRTDTPKTLRVRATDADADAVWTVRLSSEPAQAVYGEEGPADCELSGPAEHLYTALWNRLPLSEATVTGDTALAQLWQENSGV
ncbi:maleylpyruvate isomerase family mycothiol-dependent enzyme [Streptomyces sp. NPDC050738]|uniref:maleylpyruvate isomerase family mycothiol-dependent enzyme n=1 Tax=Streptomyces sp. NPDC050738 TaxID=3154744 RepID=UPI0034411C08